MKCFKALFVLSLLFIFLTSWPQVWADRGGFSPSGHEVFESGQKAIIAWNGTHEILILSSDVKSSQESQVIEFLPLPSNSSVNKGENSSFFKVESLVEEYFLYTGFRPTMGRTLGAEESYRSVEITFHEKIGAHDLTVVKTENAQELVSWIEDFLSAIEIEYEELPSDLEDLFSVYVDEGINFFVVDVIDVNSTTKSVEPLVYEFKSSRLYYPLRISTLFSGDTDISLFTITTRELNDESILKEGFQKMAQFNITPEALRKINLSMAILFSNNPCLCFYKYEGSLKNLKGNVSAGFSSFRAISGMAVAAFSLGTALILLLLLFPKKEWPVSFMETTKRLAISSALAALAGIILTVGGLFLPWGSTLRYGEILIPLNGLQASYALTGINVVVALCIEIFGFFLLLARMRKVASAILAATASFMILQTVMWLMRIQPVPVGYYYPYLQISRIENTGPNATLVGSSFIMFAALLSLLQLKLSSKI